MTMIATRIISDHQARNRFYQSTGRPKITEKKLVVYIGKSEAEVTNNKRIKDSTRDSALLKLTTDND